MFFRVIDNLACKLLNISPREGLPGKHWKIFHKLKLHLFNTFLVERWVHFVSLAEISNPPRLVANSVELLLILTLNDGKFEVW